MANLDGVCQVGRVDIVGAVDQDDVDKAHARKQRKDAEGHDLVFAEELLIADVAARQADADNDCGEDGAPPAVEEGRVVGDAGSGLWGNGTVEIARYYHVAVEQSSQTLASAEGELFGGRVLRLRAGSWWLRWR